MVHNSLQDKQKLQSKLVGFERVIKRYYPLLFLIIAWHVIAKQTSTKAMLVMIMLPPDAPITKVLVLDCSIVGDMDEGGCSPAHHPEKDIIVTQYYQKSFTQP